MGAAHRYLEFPRRRNWISCDHPKPEHGRLISDGQVPHTPTVQQETMFVAGTPHRAFAIHGSMHS
jgi:hypothetical protein